MSAMLAAPFLIVRTPPMDVWVAIEVTRDMRLTGMDTPAGAWTAGGVNLLDWQIRRALELTTHDKILVLHPASDSETLALCGEHNVRELGPMDFVGMMSERASGDEQGVAVLLRQTAPIRNVASVQAAIERASEHPVQASDIDGQPSLAFEVRTFASFHPAKFTLAEPTPVAIDADDVVEITHPKHLTSAAKTLARWL